jgi:hypothetical protein
LDEFEFCFVRGEELAAGILVEDVRHAGGVGGWRMWLPAEGVVEVVEAAWRR